MYLKRLELYGFKSFGNRVELDFDHGITGIVGPNGSGKSNISDAIRWVLGEQSVRVLRGSRMEDVIFAGSDSKRSLGFAEVSLVLDNSDGTLPLDYSEIMVTRRLYRSGESEYLLNKVPCRLKDILELFLDTGIGRDGYSVIEQGRVDAILSAKPEERRFLFEEAAGVARYKNKKAEACRKLKNTEESLVRLQDLLSEITRQLNSLEEESERAKRFLEIQGELEDVEVLYYGKRLAALDDDLQKLQEEIMEQTVSLSRCDTELLNLEEESQGQKAAMDSLESAIAGLSAKNHECIREREKVEGDIERITERIAFSKEQIARIDSECKQIRNRLGNMLSEQSGHEDELKALTEKINAAKRDLEEVERGIESVSVRLSDTQLRVKNNKDYIIDLLEDGSAKRNTIAAIDADLRGCDNQVTRIRSQWDESVCKLEELKEKKKESLLGVETLKARLHELDGDAKSLDAKIQGKQIELAKLQKTIGDSSREIASLESKLKVLEDMENHYDGYFKGVRELMLARRKSPKLAGICAVVAEILDVQPGYETAIEVALGSGMQNIVCKTDSDAEAAIEYLKSHRLGRATFLSLNMIRPRYLNANEKDIFRCDGILGGASQFVEYSEEYSNVVEYLLGRIVIAEDLVSARNAAKRVGATLTIVTLDGDIITPGGAITGGSRNERSTQFFSRRRIIEELRVEIAEKREDSVALQRDLEQVQKTLESLEKARIECSRKQQETQIALARCRDEAEQLKAETSRVEMEIEVYKLELAEIEEHRKALCEKKESLQREVELLAEKEAETKRKIMEDEKMLQELSAREKEILDLITEKRVIVAAFEQERSDLAKTVQTHAASIREWQERLSNLEAERDNLFAVLDNLQGEISAKSVIIEELARDEKKHAEELASARAEKMTLAKTMEDTRESLVAIQKRIAVLKEELHGLEIKRAKLEMERDNLLERMSSEYEISGEELLKVAKEAKDEPLPSMSKINELRRRVREFGNVNIGAIDEFTAQSERHAFLRTQYDDLVEARESLFKVIEEIDSTIKRQFVATFEEIRQRFQELFVRLFGGGKADLVLTNKEDVLETGVDIVAQPPGKKLQYLSLLSNGERALTAIALLLAIMRVSPSPFCVLDEIDAALDDVNVGRFVELLKEFSSKTQLIVVTHRKLTMEAVDCLYGVTMEETGVSKVVSLKFGDALPHHPYVS